MFFLSGTSVSMELIACDILPISVEIPVAVTMAVPLPLTMLVPLKTMSLLGPVGSLVSGTDSPVKLASFALSVFAAIRRASAGTLSPSCRIMTSPGTICVSGRMTILPSRITAAEVSTNLRRAANVCWALPSCKVPMMALKTSTRRMMTASATSPMTKTTPAAAIST